MSKVLSAGFSCNTPYKTEWYSKFIETHLEESRKYFTPSQKYLLVDCNSGPGSYIPSEGNNNNVYYNGSPITFLLAAKKKNIPFEAVFCEKDPITVERLNENLILHNLKSTPFQKFTICNHDNIEVLEALLKYLDVVKFGAGLIYIDPNGIPNFDKLLPILTNRNLQNIDILWHIASTNYKRQQCRLYQTPLMDNILKFERQKTMVSIPYMNTWRWNFILNSISKTFPELDDMLYNITNPIGQNIIKLINDFKVNPEEVGFNSSKYDIKNFLPGIVPTATANNNVAPKRKKYYSKIDETVIMYNMKYGFYDGKYWTLDEITKYFNIKSLKTVWARINAFMITNKIDKESPVNVSLE